MFTLSGFRQDRLSETIFPLVLNRRSDATLVAGIHKYFFAKQANEYNQYNVFSTTLEDWCLHQDKGNECTDQLP